MIRLYIPPSILFDVYQCKTPHELRSTLEQSFEHPLGVNKMHAMKRLFLLKTRDGVTVRKHVNEFNYIIVQLKALKVSFDEKVFWLLLLNSLPLS